MAACGCAAAMCATLTIQPTAFIEYSTADKTGSMHFLIHKQENRKHIFLIHKQEDIAVHKHSSALELDSKWCKQAHVR